MGKDGEMHVRDRSSVLWLRSEGMPGCVVRLRALVRHNKWGEHGDQGEAHALGGARTRLPLQVR